jgi:hypothetical protein
VITTLTDTEKAYDFYAIHTKTAAIFVHLHEAGSTGHLRHPAGKRGTWSAG